ncbi:hypothetical protein [Methanobacterium oryzae]
MTIKNIEVNSEAVLSDNAKIKELEGIISEMNKKLDKVSEEA